MKTFIFLLFAFSALARDHAALNGTWVLQPTQSTFNGQPVMQSGTVTINEREGDITVSRNFTYDGAKETYFYKDTVDSQNSASIHNGAVKSKAKWDHDALRVTTTQPGSETTETYSLAPNGTMTVNVVKTGSAPITLVFTRK
jgi:hypothetical protein